MFSNGNKNVIMSMRGENWGKIRQIVKISSIDKKTELMLMGRATASV